MIDKQNIQTAPNDNGRSNNSQGWISLHRSLTDHWLWTKKREFSQAEAWIDILLNVQHSSETQKVLIKMTLLECHQGESLKSIGTWAKRWNWTNSKVQRFFILLSKQNMIVQESERITNRICVVNWAKYQGERIANESQMNRKRIANESQTNTDNNANNANNENKPKRKNIKKEIKISGADLTPPTPLGEGGEIIIKTEKEIDRKIFLRQIFSQPEYENFRDKDFYESLMGFVEQRKRNRKNMTNRAITLLMKKLLKLSTGNLGSALELLDTATEKGWQSIYIPQEKSTPKSFEQITDEYKKKKEEDLKDFLGNLDQRYGLVKEPNTNYIPTKNLLKKI